MDAAARLEQRDSTREHLARWCGRLEHADPRRRAGRRRPLALIAAGVVVLLLGGLAAAAYFLRPPPEVPQQITPEERLRQLQADVQRLVDEGKRKLSLKEWTAAVAALDKALAKDPINKECKRLRAKALDELQNEQIFDKGQQFFALGNQENLVKAKEVFLTVDQGSIYYRDVRYKLRSINEQLAENARVEGVSRCKAKYWEQCHEALCQFFGLLPEDQAVSGEVNMRNLLQSVERRLERKRGFAACKAPRFLTALAVESSVNPDKVLSKKYPERELRDVVMLYLEGKVDMAIKALTALRGKRHLRELESEMREIDRQLLIIRGKYQEGFSALRDRDVEEAQRNLELVLNADEALVPEELESFYRREIVRSLGDLYFELGDEQFKLGQLRRAYTFWSGGLRAAPKHEKILNGLLQLEREAEVLLRKGKGLAREGNIVDARSELATARDITPPDNVIHKQVLAAIQELGE